MKHKNVEDKENKKDKVNKLSKAIKKSKCKRNHQNKVKRLEEKKKFENYKDYLQHNIESIDGKEKASKSILKSSPATTPKRRISFGSGSIFYFQRDQGHAVVPMEGEIALGMEYTHFEVKDHDVTDCPATDNYTVDKNSNRSQEYLSPLNNEDRIKILTEAGVKIDKSIELTPIRESRNAIGCNCKFGYCIPSVCDCSIQGIGCQVNEKDFYSCFSTPCSCFDASDCKNENGRIEYDHEKVSSARRETIKRYSDSDKTGISFNRKVTKFEDD